MVIFLLIHKMIQNLIFGCVSLAANFWSSLAPCYSAMVARSRRKNWRRFLAKNQIVNHFVYMFLPFFLFSGEFRASVSQNEVGVGESFALTLTLIDASAQVSPSIEPLRKSFSIHSQQQSSNTVYNNGKLSSSTTWKYVLT